MRRRLSAALILAMFLVFTASAALAASCTACGLSISDSAHLCPRCGARQMPPTSALTITRVYSNGDGSVTVTWHGGSGPCEIFSVPMRSGSIHSDLQHPACMGLQPAANRAFTGYCGVADRLVPGQDSWIIVRDAKGTLDYHPWIPGEAPVFSEFPVSLAVQPVVRGRDGDAPCSALSAGAVSPDTVPGLSVLMTCPPSVQARSGVVLICLTSPDGAVAVIAAEDLHLTGGSDAFPPVFCDLTGYFTLLRERRGCIPSGEYACSVYLDGMYVGSQPFRVTD